MIKLDLESRLFLKQKILKKEGLSKQLLFKALGLKKIPVENWASLTVYDVTAGLGDDLCWFLAMGLNVVATERNPLCYLALKEGVRKLRLPASQSLILLEGDGSDLLKEDTYHALYFDPFFQKKKRGALTKKAMEFLRTNFQEMDDDGSETAQKLFEKCRSRLVIKRPIRGKELLASPTYKIEGKTIRFDVYYRGRG